MLEEVSEPVGNHVGGIPIAVSYDDPRDRGTLKIHRARNPEFVGMAT